MFRKRDEGNLSKELGLTEERANELVKIVQNIVSQDAPNEEYGRTSHILLNITGRKDLSDVEKTTCVFIFAHKIFVDRPIFEPFIPPVSVSNTSPRMPGMRMPGMGELKTKEFIDLEGGAAGMIIAPEGVGPEDAIGPLMAIIMSMLRQMPKQEAQNFCRHASMSFAKMALTGDIRP